MDSESKPRVTVVGYFELSLRVEASLDSHIVGQVVNPPSSPDPASVLS